jgi:hypothetical protein
MSDNSIKNDSDAEKIFDGMIFAINQDTGPEIRVNASSLTEREAIATAIQGITAVGLGSVNNPGLFGPLPVPYNPSFRTLVFVFYVETRNSDNPQVLANGRFCALFLVFRKQMMKYIANVFPMIESMFNLYKKNYLQKEHDLTEETLQLIYNEVVEELKMRSRFRLFRIENGITTEFEESRVIIGEEMTILIDEIKEIFYIYYPKNLVQEKVKSYLKIVSFINSREYHKGYTLKKINSRQRFVALLKEKKISIVS